MFFKPYRLEDSKTPYPRVRCKGLGRWKLREDFRGRGLFPEGAVEDAFHKPHERGLTEVAWRA